MQKLPAFLRRPGIMLIALIGVSGCGLSDYEKRIDAQRLRVQEFDELNRLLGDPIDMPIMGRPKEGTDKYEDGPAWPFEVFLRLPKGYGTLPKDKGPALPLFPFFRYATSNEAATSIFVAAVGIASEKDGFLKYTPDSFRLHIEKALQDYYLRAFKADYVFREKGKALPARSREVSLVSPFADPDKPVKLTYSHYHYADERKFRDHTAFDIYIREEGGKQVCIVVHRPLRPSDLAGLEKSIGACLGSLDFSADASARRAQLKKAKGP